MRDEEVRKLGEIVLHKINQIKKVITLLMINDLIFMIALLFLAYKMLEGKQ
jgi:hypothetical protein